MLAAIRLVILAVAIVIVSIVAVLYCLIRPFHRNNVFVAAHMMGSLARIVGVKIEVRVPDEIRRGGPFVFIANHQNSYDIFTVANSVLPGTVSIGKKSLKWIPFFGQMYWLSGNILIDRKNTDKAMGTITTAAKKIRENKLSVWLFPEGTRSYGRGLLPFKTGAFRTAIQAGVPIVPVCIGNLSHIKLNRWNNGRAIIEYMQPIDIAEMNKGEIRKFTDETRQLMLDKICELSEEAGHPMKDQQLLKR
ncbi:1-acylglycerol-3-phosphate O-acyltransferase [Thalassotalea agarivorans]|uniref:1-acyl-sn-glycerol-3-phosphate acyltransferase n=1 Tax=Thalassotalea agarivorans TaxID=349064 RepID=A0A1I0AZ01_THASX|nr:1-acylglycerol-3-phosphate O-acyltransferase [Thalassotalea agarivorans]SES98867.1 1-acyl-sn-glycerol-3-phosphate acyltransferase [Thalassotalea agarivorans]